MSKATYGSTTEFLLCSIIVYIANSDFFLLLIYLHSYPLTRAEAMSTSSASRRPYVSFNLIYISVYEYLVYS